jgi:pilus assembly protein FimV
VGKTSLRASIIAGVLFLLAGAVEGAGLGKLTVLSHLGEPLRAEIDVVAVGKGELETLTARLASPDAYIQSNLPYPPGSLGLRVNIDQRPSGEPYIQVTSAQPVPEPFVDVLIELNWQGGKIMRAYTALLDPPAFAAAPPSMSEPAPSAEAAAPPPPQPAEPPVHTNLGSELQQPPPQTPSAEVMPEPMPAPPVPAETMPGEPPAPAQPADQVAAAPPAEAGMPAQKEPEPAPHEDSYGPVKRGDTLSKIAREYKPDDVTLEQMLVLLYRNNKEAFSGSNMNRLKTGKVLTIPDPSEASAIPAREARKEVRVQVADFNAYRERLAALAGETSAEPSGQTAGGRVTGPVQDQGAAPSGEPKEMLKLGKGDAPGAGGSKALQDKVRGLEEEVAARDKTIREANERIAKLEKTVKDMQGLLELKSKPMAELQKPAVTPPTAKPATPPSAAPQEPPSVAVPPVTAPSVSPPVTAPSAGPGSAPMAASGTQSMAEGTPAPKPRPKPRVVPAPPPPSLVDQLLGEPMYLIAGGGVLALVLGFLGYRVMKNRREAADDSVGAEKKTSEVRSFADTGTDTGGTMVAAARAAQAQVTEEVDPLAEAEIYLAYGRDGQAEEILKEALQTHPRRLEVHIKLLEIYAKRKDVAAFDPLARDLQQATGGQGALWQQAARLGYQIDPQNPRYLAGKPSGEALAAAAVAAAATTDKTLDFQIDSLDAAPEIGTLTDIDAGFGRRFATTTAAAASGGDRLDINISLDEHQNVGTRTDIDLGRLGDVPDTPSVDVDFDSLSHSVMPGTSTDIDLGAMSESDRDTELPAMDFNLDLPAGGQDRTASEVAKSDSVDFDLKLDDFGTGTSDSRDAGLDFDIAGVSLDSGSSKAEPVLDLGASAPAMPEIDLSSISLDLGGGDAPGASETSPKDDKWYDVQTKFDLAKAYQEMGDKEGAREILREVIAEGDSTQQAAAEKVLETLS